MEFRVARHTKSIEKLTHFYTSVLELEVLGSFNNHNDYDGILLGKSDENWHLEFTQNNESPESKFDDDDILVFYPKSEEAYQKILSNLEQYQVPILEPKNPYWKDNGICFEDCDHHKIIISNLRIEK